jgi:hypothetical protein
MACEKLAEYREIEKVRGKPEVWTSPHHRLVIKDPMAGPAPWEKP